MGYFFLENLNILLLFRFAFELVGASEKNCLLHQFERTLVPLEFRNFFSRDMHNFLAKPFSFFPKIISTKIVNIGVFDDVLEDIGCRDIHVGGEYETNDRFCVVRWIVNIGEILFGNFSSNRFVFLITLDKTHIVKKSRNFQEFLFMLISPFFFRNLNASCRNLQSMSKMVIKMPLQSRKHVLNVLSNICDEACMHYPVTIL